MNERSSLRRFFMIVRRLSWAGLELQTSDIAVVVDLLGGTPSLSKWAGDPAEDLLAPSAAPGSVAAAAVTHLHSDHFDVEALQRVLAPDAPVLCPAATVAQVDEAGFDATGVEPWETVTVSGGLQFTAVPAVDGFGAAQVSWVVSDGQTRLIHCGDTLWHGYWWEIAKRCGPFDLAFLPINAAVADFDYLPPPTGLPAVLTPEQAAAAGQVLGAREVAPIHYGTFHKPPTYIAYPNAEAAFAVACARRGVAVRLLQAGDEVLSGVPA
jgi:L-ascorbate metabolism protein UlaG (beta-lactamase superfamily)